ncbi:MAG: hypothetical protein ACOX83_10875 [Candidatus Spyradocola sp.]|jgi:hypothetical protein
MATRMGWFDVPLGADTRTLVSTPEQAVEWINQSFGKPLKYYNSAASMRDIWKVMLTNGIIPEVRTAQATTIIPETQLGSAFSIAPLTGLKVQINPGIGWIDGAYCIVDEAMQLDLVAGQVNDIVLRLDLSGSDVQFGVAVKTRSVSTIYEGLVRSGGVYELGLHTVAVPAGAAQITSAMIADHRLDVTACADGKPCCGLVGSLLQPDISLMYDRARAALQAVLDSATPPDGNLASGIYLTDSGGHYLSNNVEDALQDVAGRFNGVRYEIANKEIVVPVGAWTENAAAMRKEAVIADALIRADTDVDLQLSDAQNGKYSIQALRPQDGSVTIYTTDSIPGEELSFVMSISEVRRNA